VGIVLTSSILLEQFCFAPLIPQLGQLGSLRPMIVFLDIPLALPDIDWIPVTFLFLILYGMVISPELGNRGQAPGRLRRKKLWGALTGWWLLLIFILAGGGLYYLVQDALPKQVRNGIDSFGIRADITLPYPSGDLVHLHGSMFLLLLTVIGFRVLLKKTDLPPLVMPARTPAGATTRMPVTKATGASIPAAPATAATKQTRNPATKPPVKKLPAAVPVVTETPGAAPGNRYQPAIVGPNYRRVPDSDHDQYLPPDQQPYTRDRYLTPDPPPDCRLTTPPPVAVIMPRPAPRIGSAQPCVLPGAIEPSRT